MTNRKSDIFDTLILLGLAGFGIYVAILAKAKANPPPPPPVTSPSIVLQTETPTVGTPFQFVVAQFPVGDALDIQVTLPDGSHVTILDASGQKPVINAQMYWLGTYMATVAGMHGISAVGSPSNTSAVAQFLAS